MSSSPNSPKLIKGGLVVLDAATGAVKRTIALQYNPDTLSRSYQVQARAATGVPSPRRMGRAKRNPSKGVGMG